jgi:hypothetical protein
MKKIWALILFLVFMVSIGGCKTGGGSLSLFDDPPFVSGGTGSSIGDPLDPPSDPSDPLSDPLDPPPSNPEPATLLTLGGGLLLVVLRKLKHKK